MFTCSVKPRLQRGFMMSGRDASACVFRAGISTGLRSLVQRGPRTNLKHNLIRPVTGTIR